MRKVLILNGPNLGRLGSREPEIYGAINYAELSASLVEEANLLGLDCQVRQTDNESELIGWIHEATDAKQSVVLNPAAFTHYSYALRDAVAGLTSSGTQLIEVHISNPQAREEFRHTSVISGVASGVIAGFGVQSYVLALRALAS